jgi:hypothetical protein
MQWSPKRASAIPAPIVSPQLPTRDALQNLQQDLPACLRFQLSVPDRALPAGGRPGADLARFASEVHVDDAKLRRMLPKRAE